jgi:shikimate kinase
MQKREPFYREIADFIIDTSLHNAKTVAQNIVKMIERT